ncbi:hypothetical protein CYMTET_22946 [Cymbomonas tetramitiformis]|uniref:Uncharacterized protein n=1 Tax=Cymbomonas tetramitiformis TaxID=36881 RepID=A0AAE0L1E9_9CHLO|nr:hypothetical protein CYMTET_22946 [Cymbomonas tetramitiformis]
MLCAWHLALHSRLKANLQGARLIKAGLEGAILDGANMNQAKLEGLDFENVQFSSKTLLDGVDFPNFVVPSERRLPPPDNSLLYALFKQTTLQLFEGQGGVDDDDDDDDRDDKADDDDARDDDRDYDDDDDDDDSGAAAQLARDTFDTMVPVESFEAYCEDLLPNFVSNLSVRMQDMLKKMLSDLLGKRDLAYEIFFKDGAKHLQEGVVECVFYELENGRRAFLLDARGDLHALLSSLQKRFGDGGQFDVPKGGEKPALELLKKLLSKKKKEEEEDKGEMTEAKEKEEEDKGEMKEAKEKDEEDKGEMKEEEAQEDIRKAVKEWIREQVEPKIEDLAAKADKQGCMKYMSSLLQELNEGTVITLLSKSHQRDLSKFLSEEQESPDGFLSKILKESDPWRQGFEEYVKRQAEIVYWKQVKFVQSKPADSSADSSETRALQRKVHDTVRDLFRDDPQRTSPGPPQAQAEDKPPKGLWPFCLAGRVRIWPSADKGPVKGRLKPPPGDKTSARKRMVRAAVKFEKRQKLLMQEWVQKFAQEKLPSYMADSVCNAAAKVKQGTTRGWLAGSTKYELKGTRGLLHKMMTISPLQLTKHLDELDYLMNRLDKAEEPVQSLTWEDSIGAWVALSELLPVIQAERGRRVLEAIFADKDVLDALGKGEFFLKSTGVLPQHMLSTLKANLVGHMQTNLYMYKQAIQHEQANIRRVQEMQGRFIALVGATVAAILIGIANVLGQVSYDYYVDYVGSR